MASTVDVPAAYVHVEAIQTVTAARPAEPGLARRVAVPEDEAVRAEALRGHVRLVLYYKRSEEDAAWKVAAWIKETLSEVLPAEPLLSGRLRREREAEGWWEVKHNDAGVRMVQARSETSMEALLACKEEREKKEAALAYWLDIDPENPHFSALFYVQVTRFEGDGYSIGVSCSLLLTDPFFLTRFLKSWAAVHSRILARANPSHVPIFHLRYFTISGRTAHPIYAAAPSAAAAAATTVLFKVPRTHATPPSLCALAAQCIKTAAERLDCKPVSELTLIVNDHAGDLKVATCDAGGSATARLEAELSVAWWGELGAEEIALGEGNKPVHVSYRVVPGAADRGLVVVSVPVVGEDASDSDLMIVATIPQKA